MNCEDLKLSREQEVWVQLTDQVVPYIKPYYYISNWGRIGSMYDGTFKILIPHMDQDGYLYISLQLYPNIIDDVGHIRTSIHKRVNRLVIMSFYPIPFNYKELEVNHINNVRHDNHLWNLEWVTSIENTSHAIRYGNMELLQGSKNPNTKLTDDDVYKMVELAKMGKYSIKDLCEIFDISSKTILKIFRRQSWTHLNLDISDEDIANLFTRISFTPNELDQICKFFEGADINNRSIYPGPTYVVRDCFYKLGLDKKYDFESKRNTMIRILEKSYQFSNKLDKYNYNFIR